MASPSSSLYENTFKFVTGKMDSSSSFFLLILLFLGIMDPMIAIDEIARKEVIVDMRKIVLALILHRSIQNIYLKI